jgi:UDP-2-acetamido-3-amino-2,3-dideoxy-glucuronate N-acetyltransferase
MTTPKVAVAGAGYWGKNLVRNFANLGALGAVVDSRADVAGPLAAQFNAPALSLEAALASADIDGIAIASPAETHADIALAAFAAGKHVYVEKPMALTVADAERMRDAATRAHRVLMVGHLLQYHPAFVTLLARVKAGDLGTIRTAYSHRLSLGKTRVEENVLWSFAPHDVSMLLAIFGAEPVSVRGAGGAFLTRGVEDEYRLDMTFADGARAHVFASWMHPFKEHRLVVAGDEAMAVFEDSAKEGEKLRLYRHRFDMGKTPPEPIKADVELLTFPKDEPLQQECAHFLECIAGRKTPRTDGDEGLRVLRVLTQV